MSCRERVRVTRRYRDSRRRGGQYSRLRYDAGAFPTPTQRRPVLGAVGDPRSLDALTHELRTPLAVMKVTVDLLKEFPSLETHEVQLLLTHLECATLWVNALLQNRAAWETLQTSQVELPLTRLRLSSCLKSPLDLVQPLLNRKQQIVQVHLHTDQDWVCANRQAIEQVIVNLLVNAAKYGPRGDVIDIVVSAYLSWVEMRVTDHGAGVAEGEQEHVFQPYVRGAAGRQDGSGLGLGLAIVKHLVEVCAGRVGVESRLGEITSFWIRLPLVSEACGDQTGRTSFQLSA